MVSAIITTKNRLELLKRAFKSVLKQTYSNIEILIVDDNSNDGTKEYCESLLEKYDNLKYIYINEKDSNGANYARNMGIKKANGEYIAFLDDDDEWYPEKIERLVYAFNNSYNKNLGLIFSATEKINSYSNGRYIFRKILKHNIKVNLNTAHRILFDNFIGNTSNPLIKKSALIDVGCFDEDLKLMQDFELWIRICQKYDVLYVDEPLIKYYSENNLRYQVTNSIENFILSREYINKKHKKKFDKLTKKEKKVLTMSDYRIICDRSLMINDKKKYRKYALKLLKLKFNKKNIAKYLLSFIDFKLYIKLKLIYMLKKS